ncbi:MAG: hypothetical protein OEY05_09325 [Paracoccaceae bacterium]|nr:hypothetical protein [Paracoccaceae bacterium]MDH5530228.1 hypothetical protein [Paracoccaceae bacterium]
MTTAPREDWEELLDPEEQLLWVGTPASGIRFTPKAIGTSVFGLFVFGFAIFWTVGAATPFLQGLTGGMPQGAGWFFIFFPLFGLPFIAAGYYMVIGQYFRDARQRRHTRYALTNRRALITSWAGKRTLKSFPIGPTSVVDYQPGPEATIYFATEVTKDSDGDTNSERIGFEHVPDGDAAYAIIRRIQSGAVE